MRNTSGNNIPRLLGTIIVLQVLTLMGQWVGAPASLPAARAQIPDAGAQQNEIIEQLKTANSRLDRMIGIFESGKLQVKLATPDENQEAPRAK